MADEEPIEVPPETVELMAASRLVTDHPYLTERERERILAQLERVPV